MNTPTKQQLAAAFAHTWGNDTHMVDHCVKTTDVAVILENGAIFAIDKRRIKNNFCFGYSTCGQGPEYEDAEKVRERVAQSIKYFRDENTSATAEELKEAKESQYMYTYTRYYGDKAGAVVSVLMLDRPADFYKKYYPTRLPDGDLKLVSDGDRETIVAAYEEAHKKHCKKVDTYIKRYGLSKVRTWTYWLDE